MALLIFDNDGVLRDESVSYQRCKTETVDFFTGKPATKDEMEESLKKSNDDWQGTYEIIENRGIKVNFNEVKEHFQDLYLGTKRDFTGYINNEPWLADNHLLLLLKKKHQLAIVSGAPREEIEYTLKKNKAFDYFSLVLGMNDCNGKRDGLEKTINHFNEGYAVFCDDRPAPIKMVKSLSLKKRIYVFGIMPPQAAPSWNQTLKDAGAVEVFNNVQEYCKFLLKCNNL